ncbi:hypothetical protein RAHE111665_09785 [Rariglobus hedericola]
MSIVHSVDYWSFALSFFALWIIKMRMKSLH